MPLPGDGDRALRRYLLAVGVLFLGGYLGIAYGVHHAFPFYVFDMFDMPPATSASRLLARLPDGRVTDLRDQVGWQCPQPVVPPQPEQTKLCGAVMWSRSRDGDALRWIDEHATPGPGPRVPVAIVRRIWTFDPDGAHDGSPPRDCPLAACTVDGGRP